MVENIKLFIRTAKCSGPLSTVLACMQRELYAFNVLFHADRRLIGARGHFGSRDKDGGHTIRSAISENSMLRANSRPYLL